VPNESKYRAAEKILWEASGSRPAEQFVAEQFVRLPRTGVRVRVQEVGEGEPVLFIHGGPNAGATWVPLVQHLRGFRCLLVDRPGTGLSDPHAITAANLAEFGAGFVGAVLAALGVERAHVVASSFGGHLALRSAAAEPERVVRMVQMACPALSPGERLPPFMRLIAYRPFRRLLNILPPNARANRSIMRQLGHGASLDAERIPQAFFDWYLELQRHTDTHRNEAEMIARVTRARRQLTLSDELLAAIRTPTLFLWGEDDTFGGPDVARHLVSRMRDARVEMIPGAGHLPWLDRPAAIAQQTADFLRFDKAAASAPDPGAAVASPGGLGECRPYNPLRP
jgi:2-hydroxy-6-oxonona-2,4-dienedioate hydrolase